MLSTCGQVALSTDARFPIFTSDWVKAALERRSQRDRGREAELQSNCPTAVVRAGTCSILHAMRDEPYFPELFYHQSVQLSETAMRCS